VADRNVVPGVFRSPERHSRFGAEPERAVAVTAALAPGNETGTGMEVREEELGTVHAQHMYKLRCECGRSWFALELPKLVQCPACHKPSLVSE
jgi:hypothetical protein